MMSSRAAFDPAGRLTCIRFETQLSPTFRQLRQQIDQLGRGTIEERQKALAAIQQMLKMLRLQEQRDKRMFREWRKFHAWVNAFNARACPGLAKLTR
jgi:hypothetical protein